MTELIQTFPYIVHGGTTISEIVHLEYWLGIKVNVTLLANKAAEEEIES